MSQKFQFSSLIVRMMAFLLDLFIFWLFTKITLYFLRPADLSLTLSSFLKDDNYQVLAKHATHFFLFLMLFLCYLVLFECSTLQGSIGKKCLRIKVISRSHHRLSFFKVLLRNLIKLSGFALYFLELLLLTCVFSDHLSDSREFEAVDLMVECLSMLLVVTALTTLCVALAYNRKNKQALHDLAAGSYVVRILSSTSVQVADAKQLT